MHELAPLPVDSDEPSDNEQQQQEEALSVDGSAAESETTTSRMLDPSVDVNTAPDGSTETSGSTLDAQEAPLEGANKGEPKEKAKVQIGDSHSVSPAGGNRDSSREFRSRRRRFPSSGAAASSSPLSLDAHRSVEEERKDATRATGKLPRRRRLRLVASARAKRPCLCGAAVGRPSPLNGALTSVTLKRKLTPDLHWRHSSHSAAGGGRKINHFSNAISHNCCLSHRRFLRSTDTLAKFHTVASVALELASCAAPLLSLASASATGERGMRKGRDGISCADKE